MSFHAVRERCTRWLFLAALMGWPAMASAIADDAIPKPIELWPGRAPGASGDSDEDRPAIYPFLPAAGKNTGAAVLICPGGGYQTRCSDHEGVVVARWLNERGIAGILLRYRIRPLYTLQETTQDAQRAMQYIRAHADEWRIAPDRIGIVGFSAGAHLAAHSTFHPRAAQPDSTDRIERFPSRPNFLSLVYGSAPLKGSGSEEGAQTPSSESSPAPPTFLFCTAEDAPAFSGMMGLALELRREKVPTEIHVFSDGEHGVSLAPGDPVLGAWPGLWHTWMRAGGFITGRARVAVGGVVTVDGEPLPHGSVTFTSIGDPDAPPVTAYVFNTGPVRGEYLVRADRGPTPGRYRVEVRQDAARWVSNSRDPVILRMNQKQRAGQLTEPDRREWFEYIRKRDLSPRIEGVRVFPRGHSGDAGNLVVEVKATGDQRFDLNVSSK